MKTIQRFNWKSTLTGTLLAVGLMAICGFSPLLPAATDSEDIQALESVTLPWPAPADYALEGATELLTASFSYKESTAECLEYAIAKADALLEQTAETDVDEPESLDRLRDATGTARELAATELAQTESRVTFRQVVLMVQENHEASHQMDEARATLIQCVSDVEGSVARHAEEMARLAEEEARQAAAARAVWYVEYYNDYYTYEAAADGSCTQWADGYFIAHSWSASGKRILSKPAHVVVDGVLYHYADSQVISQDSKFDEALKSFVYANGGIGFQTCLSGTGNILVLHYEPGE